MGGYAGHVLNLAAHLVGPGLRAENAVLKFRVAPEIDALAAGDIHDPEKITGGAGDNGNAEILHQHQLLFGVASADRQHGAAAFLAAVMKTESSREQPVAVCHLQHVFIGDAVHRKTSRGRLGPDFDVACRVGDADWLAGSAGRTVEPDNLLHRRRGEPKRIFVPEIRLHHERKLGDILERDYVAGLYTLLIAPPAEKRNALVFIGDEFLKFRELERAKLFDRHEIRCGNGIVRHFGYEG